MKERFAPISYRALSLLFLLGVCLLGTASSGYAAVSRSAEEDMLQDAILKAVSTHPEVQAKWHAFRASEYEKESMKAGYRPKVDFTAGIGHDSLAGEGYSTSELFDYDRRGVSLFLTQMLYDGNLTNSSVKRYDHVMRMRYYDMIATMEQSALATVHVWADLIRYHRLMTLARTNLDRHIELMNKVEERTREGLDSAVNLETAKGRLALANVNLITEESNFHDTVTQYIRIVGEAPPQEIFDIDMHLELPADPQEGVETAIRYNPLLLSYAENSRSMHYAVEEQRANFRPRLDLRAGTSHNVHESGTEGWRRKSYIELVLTYNLYNGGRDKANLYKTAEQRKESIELFKKLERDIIQSVLVAHNDIQAYERQLPNLKQHSFSANATRKAYVQQFEAGRRSLLDLLDSENEFYQAELSYVNADFNQRTAKADYLASIGKLLEHYFIVREDIPAREDFGFTGIDPVSVDIKSSRKEK